MPRRHPVIDHAGGHLHGRRCVDSRCPQEPTRLSSTAMVVPAFKRRETRTWMRPPEGLYVDSQRNLWVANSLAGTILKFARGGTSPIATFNDPSGGGRRRTLSRRDRVRVEPDQQLGFRKRPQAPPSRSVSPSIPNRSGSERALIIDCPRLRPPPRDRRRHIASTNRDRIA